MKKRVLSSPSVVDRFGWSRKRLLSVGAAILVVIAGLVLWYIVAHREEKPTYTMPQYTGLQLVNEVNKRYGANDYIGAIRLIEGQASVNETETQLLLAGAYANSGDNTKALSIYDTLESKRPLSEVDASTAGDIAERTGDHQKALAYFKKAKDRADPDASDQIAVYEYRITELEKK